MQIRLKPVFISQLLLLILFSWGCGKQSADVNQADQPAEAAAEKKPDNLLKGPIVGRSNKAKTISITVGKGDTAKTIMVRYDDDTTGVEHATKGEAAIIQWEQRGEDKFATVIKPKLAKLPAGVTEIQVDELFELIENDTDMVLIDARPKSRYDQAHLPGAISIPVPQLKAMKTELLPADKDTLLIFYCGGYTWGMTSTNAGLAVKLGYTNVRGFLAGEPAWSKAGHPVYASNEFVEKGNIVLIDLRDDGSAVEGRIPGSVHINYAQLEERIDDIPRNAPVVLYSDDHEEVLEALDDLRFEGFKNVSLVKGNYQGWLASGGTIEKGPIFSTEIRWVRKLGKGEVSVAEFKKAVNGELPDIFVIDARTPEEIAELGIFPNTVNIPLDQIPKRMADIPKDQRVFVHCSTGARADLAYRELIKNGYDVKFLLLDISDPECDCPIIIP